jgi:hypothetical protein
MTKKQERLAKEHGLEPEDFDTLRLVLGTVPGGRKQHRNYLVVEPCSDEGGDVWASILRLNDAGLVVFGSEWLNNGSAYAHVWHATEQGAAAIGVRLDVHGVSDSMSMDGG